MVALEGRAGDPLQRLGHDRVGQAADLIGGNRGAHRCRGMLVAERAHARLLHRRNHKFSQSHEIGHEVDVLTVVVPRFDDDLETVLIVPEGTEGEDAWTRREAAQPKGASAVSRRRRAAIHDDRCARDPRAEHAVEDSSAEASRSTREWRLKLPGLQRSRKKQHERYREDWPSYESHN